MDIYDFNVKDSNGEVQNLSKYSGKVLLIVNTATECGFTPQYKDLQKLYEKYNKQGLEILDFPCNQFGHQAPGTAEQIARFCSMRFGVKFPQFAKIEVNGKNQDALFAYLKSKKGFKGFDLSTMKGSFMDKMLSILNPNYIKSSDIKWNFTKFLVDKKGKVVARFEPTTDFSIIEKEIVKLLK